MQPEIKLVFDVLNDAHKKQDISYFPPDALTPAIENNLLYDGFNPWADNDDYALYASLKAEGIREPLHVTLDMVILSGHRRHAAAMLLKLPQVPVIVTDHVYHTLSPDDRLSLLADYNKQRDKSYSERLREAMQGIDPDQAHERLIADRQQRHKDVGNNVIMGASKQRAKITTTAFLQAAIRVIESERDYWPLTVRRVHYLLLNDPPLTHDKKPGSVYRNDLASYKRLANLLIRARLSWVIPMEAIEDETRPVTTVTTWTDPATFVREETDIFLKGYRRDLLRGQQNHVEILVEKNAIRRHVETVAEEYGIPCSTGRGYSSLTPRWELFKRFMHSEKDRLVLLILSDFDPDGEEIAASFPRSLRDDFGVSNITAHKVALSGDDVREHGLPCNMDAKKSSPNYSKFIRRHGVHVAELDAAPVTLLQEKLGDAIEACLDMDTFRAELDEERADAVQIAATKRMVIETLNHKEE
jgi:hypothetical protein